MSNKIASLLGKLLNICVDRLCLKFSKIRIGDREKLARKTDRALGELGLTAEKRAKPCRGRAATRTPSSTRERTAEKRNCAVAANQPQLGIGLRFGLEHHGRKNMVALCRGMK